VLSNGRDGFSSEAVAAWLVAGDAYAAVTAHEYVLYEGSKFRVYTNRRLIVESSGECTPWNSEVPDTTIPQKPTPLDVYNWPIFKLFGTLILRPSNQKFRSYVFHFK
jgi:hypothetical protein